MYVLIHSANIINELSVTLLLHATPNVKFIKNTKFGNALKNSIRPVSVILLVLLIYISILDKELYKF